MTGVSSKFCWSRGEREIFTPASSKLGFPLVPLSPHSGIPAYLLVSPLQGLPYTYDPGLPSKPRLIHELQVSISTWAVHMSHPISLPCSQPCSSPDSSIFACGTTAIPTKESHLRPGRKWVPFPSSDVAHSAPLHPLPRPQVLPASWHLFSLSFPPPSASLIASHLPQEVTAAP